MSGMLGEHLGEVAAERALRPLELENSLRFGVDLRDQAVARDGQHAVAHAADEMPEKPVGLAAEPSRARMHGARSAADGSLEA